LKYADGDDDYDNDEHLAMSILLNFFLVTKPIKFDCLNIFHNVIPIHDMRDLNLRVVFWMMACLVRNGSFPVLNLVFLRTHYTDIHLILNSLSGGVFGNKV